MEYEDPFDVMGSFDIVFDAPAPIAAPKPPTGY